MALSYKNQLELRKTLAISFSFRKKLQFESFIVSH